MEFIIDTDLSYKFKNRIRTKSLRTVYDDMMIQETNFKSFYNLVKFVIVHHKNIQILTKEVSKIVNDIYRPIMKIFFSFKEKQIQSQKL